MSLDLDTAALALDQLGNHTRLRIVRLLVRAGDDGLTVGEIQRALEVPASTLSHHINHLKGADLVSQTRQGASLVCRVNFELLRGVVAFLTEECCQGLEAGPLLEVNEVAP